MGVCLFHGSFKEQVEKAFKYDNLEPGHLIVIILHIPSLRGTYWA